VLAGLFAEPVRFAHPLARVPLGLSDSLVSLSSFTPSRRCVFFGGCAFGLGMSRMVS